MPLKRSIQAGFTLIELMVTVAVVAILTSIAYPAYTSYTFRSRVPEGLEALSAFQVRMEQRFQDVGNYGTAGTTCGVPTSAIVLKNFTISCATSNSGAQFEAKVVGSGPVSGVEFRINEAGRRWTPVHPKGTKTDCWTIRGGTCDT
jgi:type IV pilus assembly protein PilE